MSQLSKDYARKARLRSLDTIAVKNNTSQDYIMWHDRLGAEPRRELVPKAQKDIGHGKGINHLPRFLAERYTTNMITQEITKISDEDWKFCNKIDWHPVDELPLKEEFVKDLKKRKKGPFIKLNSVEEIFEE